MHYIIAPKVWRRSEQEAGLLSAKQGGKQRTIFDGLTLRCLYFSIDVRNADFYPPSSLFIQLPSQTLLEQLQRRPILLQHISIPDPVRSEAQ